MAFRQLPESVKSIASMFNAKHGAALKFFSLYHLDRDGNGSHCGKGVMKKATFIFVILSALALGVLWKLHIVGPKPINRFTADWACLNNLRPIDSSKRQWAEEQHKNLKDTAEWSDLTPYLGRGSNGVMPECPIHGVYTLGRIGEKTRCSIHGTAPGPGAP